MRTGGCRNLSLSAGTEGDGPLQLLSRPLRQLRPRQRSRATRHGSWAVMSRGLQHPTRLLLLTSPAPEQRSLTVHGIIRTPHPNHCPPFASTSSSATPFSFVPPASTPSPAALLPTPSISCSHFLVNLRPASEACQEQKRLHRWPGPTKLSTPTTSTADATRAIGLGDAAWDGQRVGEGGCEAVHRRVEVQHLRLHPAPDGCACATIPACGVELIGWPARTTFTHRAR